MPDGRHRGRVLRKTVTTSRTRTGRPLLSRSRCVARGPGSPYLGAGPAMQPPAPSETGPSPWSAAPGLALRPMAGVEGLPDLAAMIES